MAHYQIFGPFVLNLTCDTNIIMPILKSSISQEGETYIELMKNSYTTTTGQFNIVFENFTTSLSPCYIWGYNLSKSNTEYQAYENVVNPVITENGFIIKIDTT